MFRRGFFTSILGAIGLHAAPKEPETLDPSTREWILYRLRDTNTEPALIDWFDMRSGDVVLAVLPGRHFMAEVWHICGDPYWAGGRVGDLLSKAVQIEKSSHFEIYKKTEGIRINLREEIAFHRRPEF